MSVSKSFTAVGDGPELLVRHGEAFAYDVSGTFSATVKLQQFVRGGWTLLATATEAASGTLTVDSPNGKPARLRFKCSAFVSGTIVTSITEATTEVSTTLKDAGGSDVLQLTEGGPVVPSGKVLKAINAALTTVLGAVHALEGTITETAGAGTYTLPFTIPAGATLLDIIVNAVALWTNAGACTLKVGDTDDDGYYTAVDLKATDLLAGESISFAQAGGKAGAYIANSQVSPRYAAAARTINAIVVAASTGGGAGRTRVTVVYHLPVSGDIAAATKV